MWKWQWQGKKPATRSLFYDDILHKMLQFFFVSVETDVECRVEA